MTAHVREHNRTEGREQASHASASRLIHKSALPGNSLSATQESIGNHRILGMLQAGVIQAKLTVSRPDDHFELEADRIADAVMRMQDSGGGKSSAVNIGLQDGIVRRKCSECKEEEKKIPRKGVPGSTTEVVSPPKSMGEALQSGGQPLSDEMRAFFEPRFGYDFSDVRIHTGQAAAQTARTLSARAYTHGQNIVFSSGQYDPLTSDSRWLLAHELAHVVQQGSGASRATQTQKTDASFRSADLNSESNVLPCQAAGPATEMIQRQVGLPEEILQPPALGTSIEEVVAEQHPGCIKEAEQSRFICSKVANTECSAFGGFISDMLNLAGFRFSGTVGGLMYGICEADKSNDCETKYGDAVKECDKIKPAPSSP